MVRSVCIYCGCACLLDYQVEDNKIVRVLPVKDDPVSEGKPCVKGLTIHEIRPKRVTEPLIRDPRGNWSPISWDYALELLKDELENYAPSETVWVGSGEITNEDNFVIARFAKEVIRSPNVDSCARVCHAPTVQAYKEMLGIPATPHFWNDIYALDLILTVGTNPASNYPAMFSKIMQKKQKGLKLLSINSWKNETLKFSDLAAIVRPGTMVFFVAGIVRELIYSKGLAADIEGFDALKESLKPLTPDVVAEITGESKEKLQAFVDAIYEAKNIGVMHGMKYTQTYHGTEGVRILTALALLKDGKIITGRGKVNIQGAGDVGIYPEPGGLTLVEAFLSPHIKFAFISIMNPARSLPALTRIWKNMRRMFIVHATPYFNASTEYADIVLPTPLLYEREGTITNGERRVRVVRRVVDPPPLARQEWEFLTELADMFGVSFGYKSVKDVTYDIVLKVPGYHHLDVEGLYMGEDQFAEKGIKKKRLLPFSATVVKYPGYPLTLVTGRKLFHFVTGDLTRTAKTLRNAAPENLLLVNPEDAKKYGVEDGKEVLLQSPEGELRIKAKISDIVPPGVVCAAFHFEDSPVNVLTPPFLDPESKIPSYKAVPVRIERSES